MSEPNDADRKKYLRRRIAAILFVALAFILVGTYKPKRPPDLRRLCEVKCLRCNIDDMYPIRDGQAQPIPDERVLFGTHRKRALLASPPRDHS